MQSRALVILPGWGHSAEQWEDFCTRNEKCIVIEPPGFGTEPLVNANWGIPEYANWTKLRIESLGLSNATLLGHSFGGRIAALIASEQPDWLSKLILYGAPVLYRPTLAIRSRIALAKFLKPMLKPILFNSVNVELAEAERRGMQEIFKRAVSFDETEFLPQIQVPTLLIWGEYDESVPLRIAEESHELIQNSQLVVIPDAGHNAHLEKPELFNGMVMRFLHAA